jgi:hypothetical protein
MEFGPEYVWARRAAREAHRVLLQIGATDGTARMTARPPIPWGLTLEQELEEFERLKPRLAALWAEVFPRDDEHYTSVIVPSVSVDAGALKRRAGTRFYEEALLFLLIRLRNPRARVVYVTSEPLGPVVMDYYLQFLAGIPVSHAAARLTLLSPHDCSPRPLAQKILERPRLLERIRGAIPDLSRAYLTVFRATPLERRLAVLLGIPLNAADPRQEALFTKSSSRRYLREAGVEIPEGCEDLRSDAALVEALAELRGRRPGLARAVLKLDERTWDEGDAVFCFPPERSKASLARELRNITPAEPGQPAGTYLERFRQRGGVVEEFVEGVEHVASGQVRINPRGQVILTSTHDEIRVGPHRLNVAGCRFPADERYRALIQEASVRVGETLSAHGLVSRLSVEFLVTGVGDPARPEAPRLLGTGINLGVGGSTHPLLAVRFLAGGSLDRTTGLFLAPSGRPKFYRASDDLHSAAYRGLTPIDLIEILTLHQLNYSPRSESGALFYMLGGVAEVGRVGMVAIGNSRAEAEAVYERTVAVLDLASLSPDSPATPS